jgi:hypothetical protein
MLRVEFISTEDDQDLVVSFAIAPAAQRSLTLLRSPQYECQLPEHERGISVSTLDATDQERDLLRSVQWLGSRVTVNTKRHEYELDISAVVEEEVLEAKAVLQKMVKDGAANVGGA